MLKTLRDFFTGAHNGTDEGLHCAIPVYTSDV